MDWLSLFALLCSSPSPLATLRSELGDKKEKKREQNSKLSRVQGTWERWAIKSGCEKHHTLQPCRPFRHVCVGWFLISGIEGLDSGLGPFYRNISSFSFKHLSSNVLVVPSSFPHSTPFLILHRPPLHDGQLPFLVFILPSLDAEKSRARRFFFSSNRS